MKEQGLTVDTYMNRMTGYSYEIEMKSDVWIGKGMGSSASYLSAYLTAWLQVHLVIWGGEEAKQEQMQMWLQELEGFYHGKASGVDTSMVLEGGCKVWQKNEQGLQGKHFDLSWLTNHYHLYLIDTGQQKNTKEAVEQVSQQPNSQSIINSIGNTTNALLELIEDKGMNQEQKMEQFGYLIAQNGSQLNELELNTPRSDDITSICDGLKVPCKISGAGLGGIMIAFVRRCNTDIQGQLEEQLRKKGFNYKECEVFQTGTRRVK